MKNHKVGISLWLGVLLLGCGRPLDAAEGKGNVQLLNPTPHEIRGHVFYIPLKEVFSTLPANGAWAVKALDVGSGSPLDVVVTGAGKESEAGIFLLADAPPFSKREISLIVSPRSIRADADSVPTAWPIAMGAADSFHCLVSENGSLSGVAFGGAPAWGLENRITAPEKACLRRHQKEQAGLLTVLEQEFEFSPGVVLNRRIAVVPREIVIHETLVNNSGAIAESHYRQRLHETILAPALRDADFSVAYFGGITDLIKGENFGDLIKGRKPDVIFPEGMCAFGFRRGGEGIAVVQESNRPDWIQGFFCLRGVGEIVSILGPYRMQAQERRERDISMVRFENSLKGFERVVRIHRDYKSWGRPRLVADRPALDQVSNLAFSIMEELPKLGLSKEHAKQVRTALRQSKREKEVLEKIQCLDTVDVVGVMREAVGVDPEKDELAPIEGKWTAIFQRQRRVSLNAAIWDYNMGRFSRALERLREAVRLGDAATTASTFAPSPALRDLKQDASGWQPYVSIVRELGHAAIPFDMARQIHNAGFDVLQASLTWGAGGLPTEYGQVTKDEQNFFDFDEFFAEAQKYRFKVNARLNPWPPRYLKEKYPNGKMISGDNTLNISPRMLGYEPEYRKLFMEQHIRPLLKRYGTRGIHAWDYSGEPMLYGGRGITDDLLKTAFLSWLHMRYQDKIDNLNAAWGTKLSSFDELKSPVKPGEAGWYDVVLFKCECLAEALRLGSEEIRKLGPNSVPVGQTYCSNVMGPSNVNNGWGYDPWISARGQLGNTVLSDIYFRGPFLKDLLRIYELYCGSGLRPVESMETNNYIKGDEGKVRGAFRMEDPDQWRCTAIGCMMFGLKGIAFWSWSGADGNWDVLDADETLSPQVLAASRTAQEFREWGPLIKSLRPVSDLGLYYPRAGFINGSAVEVENYEGVFFALVSNGIQPTLFSDSDASEAFRKFKTVIVPQSRSLEKAFLSRLADYVSKGGQVIYLGELPSVNEYKAPLDTAVVESLFGVKPGSATDFIPFDILEGKSPRRLATRLPFKQYETLGAQPAITTAKGEALCYVHPVGKGKVLFLPSPVCAGFLEGAEAASLAGTWKFNFGAQWPIRPPSDEGVRFADAQPDRGLKEKWELPEYHDAEWADIKVPGTWEGQAYDCGGWAWYRRRLVLDPSLAGKKILFYGDSLHNKAWIYVNGVLVKTTKAFNESFTVDITPHLKFGKENTLVMRIRGPDFGGGVRGNVKLVSPDLEREDWMLLAKTLGLAGVQAQSVGAPSSLVRMLMHDGAGRKFLVVANYSTEPFQGKVSINRVEIPTAHEGQHLFEPSRITLQPSSTAGVVDIPLALPRYGATIIALY